MYYTSIDYFKKIFDNNYRTLGADISSVEAFELWRTKAKEKLSQILCLDRLERASLNPVLVEEVVLSSGITRQKVIINTFGDVKMPVYILIPEGCDSSSRCFIATSGHAGGGNASIVGDRTNRLVSEAIDKYNYDYGIQLAERGNIVVCPETIGFGERREYKAQGDDNVLLCSCYNLARVAGALGYSLTGIQVFECMRVVDYLYESGEYNVSDLSILGFSGGGLQALYTSALDERIKNVIVSGYMYGYKEALIELNGNCSCNYPTGLMEWFDMGDVGALIAPRRFVIQSGLEDHLNGKNGIDNVLSQVDIIKSSYNVLGASSSLMHDIHTGKHIWCKERLDKYLDFLFN